MVSGSQYVTESGTGVKWAALATTLFSGLLFAVTGFYLTAIEALINYQLFLINGLGAFLEALVREVLGGGAALVVASWRAAAVQATEAGPLAPFLLALEAVVILLIAAAIWDRRPYL